MLGTPGMGFEIAMKTVQRIHILALTGLSVA
jgi:hypothetical protein